MEIENIIDENFKVNKKNWKKKVSMEMIEYIKLQRQTESQEVLQSEKRKHTKREKGFKKQAAYLRVKPDQKATKSERETLSQKDSNSHD